MNPIRGGRLEALIVEARNRGAQQVTTKQAIGLIAAFLDVVAENALEGEEVRLPKFGTFYRNETKARRGPMPGASGFVQIPARYALKFRAASKRKGVLP